MPEVPRFNQALENLPGFLNTPPQSISKITFLIEIYNILSWYLTSLLGKTLLRVKIYKPYVGMQAIFKRNILCVP